MALFQTSVLKQSINLLDIIKVDKAYKKYAKYFLNPTIQDNIRSSKEEEYQGIFLTELFVNILDYTLKPNADFNLVAEYKNQTNARKADGAILHNDVAIGVIELKGTNTKDLESIRKQAFDYKANQKGCVYVITSNFEKLRFYINDATEFEEFNLFELSPERFALLYLCLQKDNIINNVPLKIKEASVVEEEQITKQFYKDYSVFKRELYRDLVKRNAKQLKNSSLRGTTQSQELNDEDKAEQLKLEKNVKLTLFKKSQKLIDRYLFIFFAEDRGLLPANSTQQILDKWKDDVDFGDDRPLYTLFKQYFNFLDQGRAGTSKRAEIYAYNGGLFKEDKTLDSLEIDSELLYKHTCQLAAYDFESQVDVNILGHIFENSLNEIESVNAEIEGGDFDKQKSKRKKDGVFYTPKYITKYIVENTIGKLCDQKKTELGFKEEEYFKGRKNRNKATIAKLVTILDDYRDWLLQLTICDPACGSGAFLNQALDFLIKEHTYIDELKTKVLGGGLQFPDIENTILENNIYGVDLNEESVEIAKLSLWLRTAQPRRKLNDLSSNIKCGNSLIDSKAVAGDKAFNWETQFPKIFEKGGFDVIIGNPPYVPGKSLDEVSKNYYKQRYDLLTGKYDLYLIFIEQCFNIIKQNQPIGLIIPNTVLVNENAYLIRKKLLKDKLLFAVRLFDDTVFPDASVESVVLITSNEVNEVEIIQKNGLKKSIVKIIDFFEDKFFRIQTNISLVESNLLNKIDVNATKLGEIVDICIGIQIGGTGKSKNFKAENISIEKTKDFQVKFLDGKDFVPYNITWSGNYLSYGNWLHRKRDDKYFKNNKIIIRQIGATPVATVDKEGFYLLNTIYSLILKNEEWNLNYLFAQINSKLIKFYWTKRFSDNKALFPKIKKSQLIEIPISRNNGNSISALVDSNHILSENINSIIIKFQNYLKHKFQLEKLSKKLQSWHVLDFGEFIKELNKAIKANNKLREKAALINLGEKAGELKECTPFAIVPTLTKKDEFEWLDLFEENKQKAQALQTQINQTDKEIDQMVYELYGLTEEEIRIVEEA
ncbi:Eco57I restriction-modification methylase domain-containing protein [Winogradskyella helgolandensis]|uniref:Eco57I restriction-modification methylase domain-containing protein n=1 Tax=Winogradskyella helgolandensis TaxID=2697010 RepID=UPI0015CBBCF6|nr:TaqI-like C-terminal specificity domain-containing protein [Winogradskyella helgolandensis]